jgi:peptidoglycan/LPS O-acetylase OafA/YrhL
MLCHITVYGSFFLQKDQYYTMLNLPIIKCIATSGISIDILFIISGFLISFLLMKEHKEYGKVNLAGFFVRRFARIYPLYLLILILVIPFSMKNSHHIWTNLLFINNFLPMEKQYMNWCWTIAVEFQFYFLFGLIIWLVSKKIIGKKICGILAIGFILLPPAVMLMYILKHHYYYISNNIFLATNQEFKNFISIGLDKLYLHTAPLTYGVITAYLLIHHQMKIHDFIDRLPNRTVNIIALTLIATLLILCSNNDIWYLNRTQDVWQTSTVWLLLVYHNLLYPPLCALLLLCSSPKGIVIRSVVKFLSSAVWRPFARLSYGTYLLHPMLLLIGFSIFSATHKSFSIAHYFQFGLLLISLTYLIATPLHLLFEYPTMLRIIQLFQRRNQVTDSLYSATLTTTRG